MVMMRVLIRGWALVLVTAVVLLAARDAKAQGCTMPQLKINEVNAGEGGILAGKTGRFIELRHVLQVTPTGTPISLADVELTDNTTTIALTGSIPENGHYVVCSDTGAPVANCDQMDANLDALAAAATIKIVDPDDFDCDAVDFSGTDPADPVARSQVTSGRLPDGNDTNSAAGPDFALGCPTPGASNVNLGSCGLVINEVDYDQGTSDTTAFIEIAAYDDRDLSCYGVRISDPSGVETTIVLPEESTPLAAGEYYVLCEDKTVTTNCDFEFDEDGSCSSPVAATIGDGGKHGIALLEQQRIVIDSLSYLDLVDGYTEGAVEAPSDLATDVLISISRLGDMNDTDTNETDFRLACATPGAANVDDLSCACGTGTVEGDEECDDGNDDDTDDCIACVAATCGDGFIQSGVEACDDDGENTATCDSDCTAPACGDGVWNFAAGELCDPSDSASPGCKDDCTPSAFARGSGGCNSGGSSGGWLLALFALLALWRWPRPEES